MPLFTVPMAMPAAIQARRVFLTDALHHSSQPSHLAKSASTLLSVSHPFLAVLSSSFVESRVILCNAGESVRPVGCPISVYDAVKSMYEGTSGIDRDMKGLVRSAYLSWEFP